MVPDLGGWLFRRRTWLPLPLVVALLLFPPSRQPGALLHPSGNQPPLVLVWMGVFVVAAGEALRLWAVHHIGVVSRTRSERLGPLITSGPFGLIRNPLYVGNVALWIGFTISAGVLWLLPVVSLVLAFEYHAIVRWEEQLLESRIGEPYRIYMSRVPRWVPGFRATETSAPEPSVRFSWRDTLFSERGTLVAIVVGYCLLWLKMILLE